MGVLKRALYCALFAACSIGGFAPRGFAHRGPAEVLSLPAWSDGGALVLRLNEGLAIRRCDRWQYVCPALWGADNIAQAEAIPGGPVAIAGPSGLFLLGDDGSVTPHPDQAALGPVIRFATAGGALFALRTREQRGEVVRVTPSAIEVVWSDPGVTWTALAADDTALHLLRLEGTRMFHAQLTLQGEPLATEEVTLPEAFVEVRPKVARGQLYVTALRLMGGQELGQVAQGAWLSHCTAGDNLSGPVESEGQLLVTVNWSLARLEGQCSEIIATPEPVSCVGREDGRSYACTRSGATQLHRDGVGSALFLLAELAPPDLGVAPVELRPMCSAQWSRYREDLVSLGVIDRTTASVGISSDGACGGSAGDAGSGGGGPSAGAAGFTQAGGNAAGAAAEPRGCGIGGAIDASSASSWLVLIALGFWIGHRSRRAVFDHP